MKNSILFETLLKNPLDFEANDGIRKILESEINFNDLRILIKRIYDINESQLKENSNANSGTLGILNRRSSHKRFKKFCSKIDKQTSGNKFFKIYAEGDSWFQFPVFIKDIIDWLNERKDFIIYSDAYGGDWITNILYEEQYIAGLSTYAPDIFLISGGGNDLLGNHRLSIMVDTNRNCVKYRNTDQINSNIISIGEKKMILRSQDFITKEFYALLIVFKLQYSLLFNKLYYKFSKHKNIICITQGYDYAIPSHKLRFNSFIQPFLNKFLDSGNWLFTPFMIKGIIDSELQKAIAFTMIYEFNEMLISLSENYSNVFHVDCRGVATNDKHWFDELHLVKKRYKIVAKAYDHIIRNHVSLKKEGKKVIRAVNFD